MLGKIKPEIRIKPKKLKLQRYKTKFKALNNQEHKIQKVEMVELVHISKTIMMRHEKKQKRHRCGFSEGMFKKQTQENTNKSQQQKSTLH